MKYIFEKTTPLLIILSLLGFADAAILTYEHYSGVILPCGPLNGCGTVLSSKYATVMGIPTSAFGMAYYGLIFASTLYVYLTLKDRFLKYIALLTFAGIATSAVLVYLMAFIIKEYCLYCLGSAVTSTLLFGVGINYLLHTRKKEPEEID